MDTATLVLLGISLVIFFGFFAEFLFKKLSVPDVLFLILLGFAIGPYGFKLVSPSDVAGLAPAFTTFTLLFLVYEGAFNMDLASFARGLGSGVWITIYNFAISAALITGILFAFRYDIFTSLLLGFILGGVSSAFVIPVIKQLSLKGKTYSALALESAFTDVLCIVFALTTMEVIRLRAFDAQQVISNIVVLFAVAAAVGILAGALWIFLVANVFKEHKSYMVTVAFLILVYVATQFLGGNGAIATLFFGLMLKNSRELTALVHLAMHRGNKRTVELVEGIAATSKEEEFFYAQISFLLKTFFFVYIGIILSLSDWRTLVIGGIIAVVLTVSRNASYVVTKSYTPAERQLISSMFARGLAAAAIAQVAILTNVPYAVQISDITYSVIVFTIIFSSVRVFFAKRALAKETVMAEKAEKVVEKAAERTAV